MQTQWQMYDGSTTNSTKVSVIVMLAEEAARGKVDKYELAADAMQAVHLPFAVETMGGLSESAQQLIREIHHSVGNHNTWRDAAIIGTRRGRSRHRRAALHGHGAAEKPVEGAGGAMGAQAA